MVGELGWINHGYAIHELRADGSCGCESGVEGSGMRDEKRRVCCTKLMLCKIIFVILGVERKQKS